MNNVEGLFKNLVKVNDAKTKRVSSWDQSGRNQDYWLIPAGETVVLGELDGPGCITHIWMTSSCRRIAAPGLIDPVGNGNAAPVNEIHPALGVVWDAYDPYYYRKALIKMIWDDSSYPSVLTPFGDFFGIGHSLPGNYSSLPMNVSVKPEESKKFGGPASVACYFPMPFNKKAKIEIINENDVPFILYFHIDYETYNQPFGSDLAYFHASWRRELPCNGWGPELQVNTPEVNSVSNLDGNDNYVVLDAEGTGHYVGCNLSVLHFQGSWWGEGDDMFFIDGEKLPSIIGTGCEDYFNHAWGMQKNAFPFYGSIIHESDMPGYQVSYRFHITDPVRFNQSLKVTMEHGHANHLADDWSSTAYWYQTQPAKNITIQPVEERLPIIASIPTYKTKGVTLNAEMTKAHENYEKRFESYMATRQQVLREKETKARRESAENQKNH